MNTNFDGSTGDDVNPGHQLPGHGLPGHQLPGHNLPVGRLSVDTLLGKI